MQQTAPLFSFQVFGFTVNIQSTFGLILGVYLLFQLQAGDSLVAMISWPIVVLVSIVIHELGHAVACRQLKVPVGTIELHGMGGHVSHARTEPKRQLAISLAGPFAGLAVGFACYGFSLILPDLILSMGTPTEFVQGAYRSMQVVIGHVLFINIVWSLVNLLPIGPLDGASALRSLLALFLPAERAVYIAAVIGLAVAALSAAWAYRSGEIFIAMFCAYFGYHSWQTMQRLGR